MSRLHPFDLVFGEVADATFPRLLDESAVENIDIAAFAKLSVVQELIGNLGVPEIAAQNVQALEEYLLLVYVAYRFWGAGRVTHSIDRTALEQLFDRATTPRVSALTPCYLMLPEHWFWAQIDDVSPHEPMDGLFVTPAGTGHLAVVGILGLRPERRGFSQISVTAPHADVEAAPTTVRRPLFSPMMAGGAEAGFHSIASLGELLYLTDLALNSVKR